MLTYYTIIAYLKPYYVYDCELNKSFEIVILGVIRFLRRSHAVILIEEN